ncbi:MULTISPECIES: NAD(P)-dependent oxidoreductase [Chryseobacterium]|uniref:NAD(P)-dependent oxidoreductase n=1 Tax=Chryseobacterium TaxID=59732 RepID=UPI001552D0D7|nr:MULTISPECIES: NAD(P)H-binding protein [unclassified Chryseobacterium]MDC8106766.1 NAD(P)H-binding protein [Chryseobacterium sp. B21-037]MDQ1805957.1 NAD(P)H-binding protein [Chryseobacterium sp. CKR4-1]WBV55965.1 NAD(P)H-binding protein [Chryseobacterium daecheongense]
MKKVAVIGATGFVGSHVVKELENRGYEVEAIVRDASKVEQNDKVKAKSVDVNNVEQLAENLKGIDAVISTYNAGWTNPNLYNDFLTGSENIEKAVEKSGVKRLIVVGGAGSLYTPDHVQIVDTPDFPEAYKPGATAARDYLNKIKENNTLDWTFFSPAIEMNQANVGTRTGKYRTSLETPVLNEEGRSILSVEDVAVVLVDELEQNNHIRERFTAAY